jgi:hypothetical protein
VAIAGIALLSIFLDALFRRSKRDSSSAPPLREPGNLTAGG